MNTWLLIAVGLAITLIGSASPARHQDDAQSPAQMWAAVRRAGWLRVTGLTLYATAFLLMLLARETALIAMYVTAYTAYGAYVIAEAFARKLATLAHPDRPLLTR